MLHHTSQYRQQCKDLTQHQGGQGFDLIQPNSKADRDSDLSRLYASIPECVCVCVCMTGDSVDPRWSHHHQDVCCGSPGTTVWSDKVRRVICTTQLSRQQRAGHDRTQILPAPGSEAQRIMSKGDVCTKA